MSARVAHCAILNSWIGTSSNLWTDGGNWSLTTAPDNTMTAYFNASSSNTTVTLSNTTQSPAGIEFDTANVPTYNIGSSVNDGTLALTGPITVTNTVTTPQVINSGITLSTTQTLVTNSSAGSSLSLNGNITLPSAGSITITTNGGSTNFAPAATTIDGGVISGGVAGSGTSSAYSLLVNGSAVEAGESNGSAPGLTSTISAPTYQPNPNNTYSGGTNFNGQYMLVPITGDSVGGVNADGSTTVTSGPFGTGIVLSSNGANVRFQPVGASRIIYNAITKNGAGFSMTSSQANDPNSLTFAGPINSEAGNGRFVANGYSFDENLATPVFGATMVLGLAASPSFYNLPTTANSSSNITAITGPIVINDVIQNTADASTNVIFNSQNQDFYSIQFNAASTYPGSTGLGNGAFANMGAFLIGVNTVSSGTSITSGPFGQSTVYMGNTTSVPDLVPLGADRTLANPLVVGNNSGGPVGANGSGFAVSNYWINTVNERGTVTQFVKTDPTGNHNLNLTGNITVSTSRTINNNMASGEALYLGSAANPALLSLNFGSALIFQTNAPANIPSGYTVGGLTVINDVVTGIGGLTVQNHAVVQLNNPGGNGYMGTTTVTSTTASLPTSELLVTNTSGSATGTGSVNVTGLGTVGSGGILAGTGFVTPMNGAAISISSSTATSQGGMIYPGLGNGTAGTINVGTMIWNPLGRYVYAYTPDNTTIGSGINNFINGSDTLNLSSLGLIGAPAGPRPFDLNLLHLALSTAGAQDTYTLATFANGILGDVNNAFQTDIPNGTDVTSLFSISGDHTGSAYDVMVVAGPNGSQSLQLTFEPLQLPEPGSLTLLTIAALGLKRRRI